MRSLCHDVFVCGCGCRSLLIWVSWSACSITLLHEGSKVLTTCLNAHAGDATETMGFFAESYVKYTILSPFSRNVQDNVCGHTRVEVDSFNAFTVVDNCHI